MPGRNRDLSERAPCQTTRNYRRSRILKDQPAAAELEHTDEELKHEDAEKIAGGGVKKVGPF